VACVFYQENFVALGHLGLCSWQVDASGSNIPTIHLCLFGSCLIGKSSNQSSTEWSPRYDVSLQLE
jgi:hypothetical protein